MHVPYSMRDDEPDLYGSLGGGYSDDCSTDYSDDPYPHSTTYNPVIEQTRVYTQDDMDKVIQHNITKTHNLELLVLEASELLLYLYNNSEQLPEGTSQKIREFLTK